MPVVVCAGFAVESIAMLSPTVSRPGLPLFSVQWTIGLPGPGSAFGFLRCPVASFRQALQFSTWAPVFGWSLCLTIVSVCGSIVFFSYSNVSVWPDLTSTVPGEKYMLSWMYLLGDIVTPASFAFTVTPPFDE